MSEVKLVYEEYEIFDALRKEEVKLLAQKKDEKELEDLAKELAKNI